MARLPGASPGTFFAHRQSAEGEQPAVLTGLTTGWPARAKWSLPFFREHYRDVVVKYEEWGGARNDPADFVARWQEETIHKTAPLGGLIERMINAEGSPRCYLAQQPVESVSDELLRDVDLSLLMSNADYEAKRNHSSPHFWLGPAGTVTTLHFDLEDNLHVLVSGRKAFELYSPEDSEALYYKHAGFEKLSNFSPIDVERPDYQRFPRYRDAQPWRCVVEAGETLYIPATWWHHVRSLEPSISLNFWYS